MSKPMSLTVAMRDFFGMKEGQTLTGFLQEVKALDDDDRTYFRRELANVGYQITN